MPSLPAVLETSRLRLAVYQPEDAEYHYQVLTGSYDLHRKWLDWVRPEWSLKDSHAYCLRCQQSFAAGASANMGIWEKQVSGSNRQLVGTISIGDIDWRLPKGELGYWGSSQSQGMGYISEAARALGDHFMLVLGFKRLWLTCDPRNLASRRVAERAGFTVEGRFKHHRRTPSGVIGYTLSYARST